MLTPHAPCKRARLWLLFKRESTITVRLYAATRGVALGGSTAHNEELNESERQGTGNKG